MYLCLQSAQLTKLADKPSGLCARNGLAIHVGVPQGFCWVCSH